jgi:hypothetical protein
VNARRCRLHWNVRDYAALKKMKPHDQTSEAGEFTCIEGEERP